MIKKSIGISDGIGFVTGGLSLVLLLDHAIRVSWIDALEKILDYYVAIKVFLFKPLEPIVSTLLQLLSQIVSITIQLSPHWSDVFVLLLLYFGARARAYWSSGLKGRAVFRYIWGGVISFLTAVLCGVVPLTSTESSVLMAATTLFGILIFELGDCSWSATFARKPGYGWWADFRRYGAFSFLPLILGFVILTSGYFVAGRFFPNNPHAIGLLILLTFAPMFAIYWLYRGWQFADKEFADPNESRWEKFKHSSNTRIGVLMLSSILGALIFILLNAGLSYAGL